MRDKRGTLPLQEDEFLKMLRKKNVICKRDGGPQNSATGITASLRKGRKGPSDTRRLANHRNSVEITRKTMKKRIGREEKGRRGFVTGPVNGCRRKHGEQ